MDVFFEDAYAKSRNYSPGLLASQFGRYYDPPEPYDRQKELPGINRQSRPGYHDLWEDPNS